jgi:hypothetical protein
MLFVIGFLINLDGHDFPQVIFVNKSDEFVEFFSELLDLNVIILILFGLNLFDFLLNILELLIHLREPDGQWGLSTTVLAEIRGRDTFT